MIGVALIAAINVVTVFCVARQVCVLQQTVRDLNGLAVTLPPEFESRLECDLKAVVADVKTSADTAESSVTPTIQAAVNDIEHTVATVKESANRAIAELPSEMRAAIVDVSSNVLVVCTAQEAERSYQKAEQVLKDSSNMVEMCRSKVLGDAQEAERSYQKAIEVLEASSNMVEICQAKVLGNELEAEKSYQKAMQALRDGDLPLAKLYCINAINHFPAHKQFFEKLIEVSGGTGGESRDDLEQIKGALELGIFQVAADDVLDMRNMLAGVIEKIRSLDEEVQSSREEEEKALFAQTLMGLRKGDLSYEAALGADFNKRLTLLHRRLAVIRDIDKEMLSTNDVTWVEEQENKTKVALEYFGLIYSIDSYLTRAEKLLEEDPSKLGSVNVMVQTASQSLSQAFGIEKTSLPAATEDELQSFAKRIEAIEIKFNKIKSQPAVKEIRSLIAKIEGVEVYSPYQKKIDSIEDTLSTISQKLPEVFDPDARSSLEREIKKVTRKLGECRQAQYKAYQMWTIDRCKAGMDKYMSWKRVDIVDAEYVVYTYLIEIDSTLLSPDVARLYHDILGKQFAELKDHTAKVEIDLAKHSKRQLSDF